MAGVIEQYVASLRRELDFDPALARRLASEVEDHLRDAAEADPAWPSPDAERRAVERFGVAREIAAQFAADAVDRQARRTWITLLVTVVVTFIAMRLRAMWLDDGAILALAPLVDRYAFIAAIAVGAIGWFAFRRSLLPLAICVAALAACWGMAASIRNLIQALASPTAPSALWPSNPMAGFSLAALLARSAEPTVIPSPA